MFEIEELCVGFAVRFTGKGGYDFENYRARQILEIDRIYTVIDWQLENFSTQLVLSQHPALNFNSVMFEAADGK